MQHAIYASDVDEVLWIVAAAGLGQYVEALVRKGGAEFNVRLARIPHYTNVFCYEVDVVWFALTMRVNPEYGRSVLHKSLVPVWYAGQNLPRERSTCGKVHISGIGH